MHHLIENAWILSHQQVVSWADFVVFWEKTYDYTSTNESYDTYVLNRSEGLVLTANHVRELYQWKNGTGDRIAERKAAGLENKIIGYLPVIQQLCQQWDANLFNSTFGTVTTIWQTFLMHIIQPDRFPIFDQHVYRAYAYLQSGQIDELKGVVKQQLAQYRTYQSFFDGIQQASQCHPRDLDKALWAFGKFIKQYPMLVKQSQ